MSLLANVLEVARLDLLGPGVDSPMVAEALVRATVTPAQDIAESLGRTSSPAEWKTKGSPPLRARPGAYWLEWEIPPSVLLECAGAPLGVLAVITAEKGAYRVTGLCFMFKTPLVRFEFEIDTEGEPRVPIPIPEMVKYVREPEPEDEETRDRSLFSWIFIAPVLLALSAKPSAVRLDQPKKGNAKSMRLPVRGGVEPDRAAVKVSA